MKSIQSIQSIQYWIIGILIIIIILCLLQTQSLKEHFFSFKKEDDTPFPYKINAWIINLDKNVDRLNQSMTNYNDSDLPTAIPIQRFSAIVGKELEPSDWLSETALTEFKQVEKYKYRTKHYQLTKGGIGCYLSHLTLFKQLLDDNSCDMYLMLEDDIKIDRRALKRIGEALNEIPDDWDMLLIGYARVFNYNVISPKIAKIKSFWGTCGYIINKKGVRTFLENHQKVECQIDSYMAWLAIKNKLNVYATTTPVVLPDSFYTDIQINIFPKNKTDAFTFRDTYLGD
jgi:GR25 family glycosyltransferase involved in LPS biosynthesis